MIKHLFSLDAPKVQWADFEAEGFKNKVTGVIFDRTKVPCCGMPLGGLATGCIDIDTRGVYGLSHIFNPVSWTQQNHFPVTRRINIMEPILGISSGGRTWVLTTPEIIAGGEFPVCTDFNFVAASKFGDKVTSPDVKTDVVDVFPIDGVEAAKNINYWGHYPVTDMEFETDCPVVVGMRAWSSFIPGELAGSNIPAAVFEVRLRNCSGEVQKGTLAYNFPGLNDKETTSMEFTRRLMDDEICGVLVEAVGTSTQYVAGVIEGRETARFGGTLNPKGKKWIHTKPVKAWKDIASGLPPFAEYERDGRYYSRDSATSIAVDFELRSGEEKTVRFVLAWYAPDILGGTRRLTEEEQAKLPDFSDFAINKIYWKGNESDKGRHTFKHMYAARFSSAADVAREMAVRHEELLSRILSWQQEIYNENKLPGWLKDSLINNFALFAECGYWFMPRTPLGDWAFPDGVFTMNESPRVSPDYSCIPCDWYGNMPVNLFFPSLSCSNLRAFKEYQLETGEVPFALGRMWDLPDVADPMYYWQVSLNGMCYVDMVDRLWRCTGDDSILEEFYDSVKRVNTFTMTLRTKYGTVIGMPDIGGMEWFEHGRWVGMAAHMGGLRLAELKIAERMAEYIGDKDYADQCRKWFDEGSGYMEEDMWNGTYYLNYYDKETGEKSDDIMAYQLDGEWTSLFHGLGGVFRQDRVLTTLETIKKFNVALTPNVGAANFCHPDGSPLCQKTDNNDFFKEKKDGEQENIENEIAKYGSYTMFCAEVALLAMTYIYKGQKEFGLELLRKHWENNAIKQGHIWDLPNMVRGDNGERTFGTDYYQNMMLWSVPIAIDNADLDSVRDRGGFIKRIIEAGRRK